MDNMGYDLKSIQPSVKCFTVTSIVLSQGANPHGRIEYYTCMGQYVKFINFRIHAILRLLWATTDQFQLTLLLTSVWQKRTIRWRRTDLWYTSQVELYDTQELQDNVRTLFNQVDELQSEPGRDRRELELETTHLSFEKISYVHHFSLTNDKHRLYVSSIGIKKLSNENSTSRIQLRYVLRTLFDLLATVFSLGSTGFSICLRPNWYPN